MVSWYLRFSSSRSPHGERGLKFHPAISPEGRIGSLPSRGAWIEILPVPKPAPRPTSRSPHGERGLKLAADGRFVVAQGRRSPHGERGLKYRVRAWERSPKTSLPSRGAWIEIVHEVNLICHYLGSLPSRGAWIEITEILPFLRVEQLVAPLTGSVD